MARDIVSSKKRSEMMRNVRQQRTPSEKRVGQMLYKMGRRFRYNNRSLPGSPDLSNQREGWAIFVNGCFWHGHKNCPKTKSNSSPRIPARNAHFWSAKIFSNRLRDARNCRRVRQLGIRAVIIWECQLRSVDKVNETLRRMVRADDRR